MDGEREFQVTLSESEVRALARAAGVMAEALGAIRTGRLESVVPLEAAQMTLETVLIREGLEL